MQPLGDVDDRVWLSGERTCLMLCYPCKKNAPDESSSGPASRPSAVKDSHLWACLCAQAAALGSPYLVSFSGMAEVFGKAPTVPLTAPPDRRRVLRNWATEWAKAGKGDVTLEERVFPFAAVRPLSPVQRLPFPPSSDRTLPAPSPSHAQPRHCVHPRIDAITFPRRPAD